MNDEHAHSVAIGGFIIGALLIALVTVLFVLGSGLGRDRDRVVMVFDGSIKGLSIGAPVALRGVEIGQVTNINLILDSDQFNLIMLVEAEISHDSIQYPGDSADNMMDLMIDRGLRAQLNLQSLLTGLLYVQLDFHPDTPVHLSRIDSEYTQIPTIPTGLEKFTRQIESLDIAQIATDLQDIAAGINQVVNQEAFRELPTELGNTLSSIQDLTGELHGTVAATRPRLDGLLREAETLVGSAGTELPRLSGILEQNLTTLAAAAGAFEQTMQEIDGLVSSDSATTYQLNKALRELALAGRSLQLLAKTLEEQPESLLRGKSGDRP
ncbi:MlaD family protein [Kineobactrum salinum]|uniref:MCE family protein n=1 Tax=Kineobactrum salinum TaxID=2708301 RepID=A0A6C0U3K1_9GAMM|nr:MlaD family protein [Kineobactrum salinum]QIB66671.1 MCE family protein [Kineobactrum salinum]